MIKSGCRLTFSFPLNYFHGLYLPIKLSTLLIIPHKMTFPAYIPDVYSLSVKQVTCTSLKIPVVSRPTVAPRVLPLGHPPTPTSSHHLSPSASASLS